MVYGRRWADCARASDSNARSGRIEISVGYDQRLALQAGRSGGPGAGGASPAHVLPDTVLVLQNMEGASAAEAAATVAHVDHGDGLVGLEGCGREDDIAVCGVRVALG